MMDDATLKTFVDVVLSFFSETTGERVSMGVPYVKRERAPLLEYTGIIGISGARRGGLYLTASATLLKELSALVSGAEVEDEEGLADAAGEVANMIAGNARRDFGSDFMISVPIVVKGAPEDILLRLRPPVFIIPVTWRTHSAYLAVGIE